MYQSVIKLPSIRNKDVRVVYPMAPKLSNRVHDSYADIECKQAKCGLLWASKHVYGHQNTACKILTRQKSEYCAILVSTFVVRSAGIVVSLYDALSREAEGMVIGLTGHAASNVNGLYEWKLDVLQTWPFPD